MERAIRIIGLTLIVAMAVWLALSMIVTRDESVTGFGFGDGDRVIFIGDSVTAHGFYPQLLEHYLVTRYPDRRLAFYNAGVGGDTATAVLDRFDDEIAPFEPDHALVMLGMNDGRYRDFDEAMFARFTKGMTKLLDRLEAMGTRVIVLSPSYFDAAASRAHAEAEAEAARAAAENGEGSEEEIRDWDTSAADYDDTLIRYTQWLREEAERRGLPFVDVLGPMREATREGRETDPAFALAEDGVHPEMIGHEVMAKAILEQLGEPGAASWEPPSGKSPLASLSAERTERAVHPLRALWYGVKVQRYEHENSGEDFEPWLAEQRPEMEHWQALADEYLDRMYEEARSKKETVEQ